VSVDRRFSVLAEYEDLCGRYDRQRRIRALSSAHAIEAASVSISARTRAAIARAARADRSAEAITRRWLEQHPTQGE